MKKHLFAVLAAAAALSCLCGCTSEKNSSQSPSSAVLSTISRDDTQYDSGNYSGEGFTLYAEPRLWKYRSSDNDTCDLRMITDKDIITCGISVYTDMSDHGGKSAEETVDSQNSEAVLSKGSLATAKLSFCYYEWAVDEYTRARTYYADIDGGYLCVYAESTNFGYVDVKIADLLSGLKLT
ncbi:hypothetical protein [uncultured Ruminococcus sp.]|uniref:hypothetical protein n=1 Tax=uncultured Ruminococcus sp. TaxID=165186 RepID=UPI0026041123|nr:hypothetical protein [uncultured Ruminococcus sp.]